MARFAYGLACIQLLLPESTLQDESTPGLAASWVSKAGGNLTSCNSIFTAYCIFDHAARLRSIEIAVEALS
jgi:hypothetical protein